MTPGSSGRAQTPRGLLEAEYRLNVVNGHARLNGCTAVEASREVAARVSAPARGSS